MELTEALKILKNVIHKIDHEMLVKFQETYKFQSLFLRIFGSWYATLEMIDNFINSTRH